MSFSLKRVVGFEYFVHDLERARRFHHDGLGFAEVGASSPELERASQQRSRLFRAGNTTIACSAPLAADGRAGRYLSRHPEGVGRIVFEVADAREAFERLEQNGATLTGELETHDVEGGTSESFSITTPFGDTTFQFVQWRGEGGLLPGFCSSDGGVEGLTGFTDVDHITANLRTMKPALLWLEHVLELRPLWGIQFHTADSHLAAGSGLRSQVLWDPGSGIKFANNEPLRPSFERSQVSVFCDENGGDGIQHVALGVPDILHTVTTLRKRGVQLMPPPAGYYERLPEHLARLGIDRLEEEPRELEELGILVDGSGPGAYLLQIFLQNAAVTFGDPAAGPFFFEVIQRKGDLGFGAGNFRALFDSVEREQLARAG
jgi:4-hydroxyphenylpyruvate dioxygenase